MGSSFFFDINKFMVSTFVNKCVIGRISVCENWIRLNRNIYKTRSSLGDPLFVPQYFVMHSKQSFLYRGLKIYNDVHMEIKLLNNPESFKYMLKKFYCCNMYNWFYSRFYSFR